MTAPQYTTAQPGAAAAVGNTAGPTADAAAAAFDAEALLEQALQERHWQVPAPWREGVLANLQRVRGMVAELDALPAEAGGLGKP